MPLTSHVFFSLHVRREQWWKDTGDVCNRDDKNKESKASALGVENIGQLRLLLLQLANSLSLSIIPRLHLSDLINTSIVNSLSLSRVMLLHHHQTIQCPFNDPLSRLASIFTIYSLFFYYRFLHRHHQMGGYWTPGPYTPSFHCVRSPVSSHTTNRRCVCCPFVRTGDGYRGGHLGILLELEAQRAAGEGNNQNSVIESIVETINDQSFNILLVAYLSRMHYLFGFDP